MGLVRDAGIADQRFGQRLRSAPARARGEQSGRIAEVDVRLHERLRLPEGQGNPACPGCIHSSSAPSSGRRALRACACNCGSSLTRPPSASLPAVSPATTGAGAAGTGVSGEWAIQHAHGHAFGEEDLAVLVRHRDAVRFESALDLADQRRPELQPVVDRPVVPEIQLQIDGGRTQPVDQDQRLGLLEDGGVAVEHCQRESWAIETSLSKPMPTSNTSRRFGLAVKLRMMLL